MTRRKLRRCGHEGCRRLTMQPLCDDHREADKTETTFEPPVTRANFVVGRLAASGRLLPKPSQ